MTSFPPRPTREQAEELSRKRRGRNVALLIVLLGMAILFYAISMVKIANQPSHPPGAPAPASTGVSPAG